MRRCLPPTKRRLSDLPLKAAGKKQVSETSNLSSGTIITQDVAIQLSGCIRSIRVDFPSFYDVLFSQALDSEDRWSLSPIVHDFLPKGGF